MRLLWMARAVLVLSALCPGTVTAQELRPQEAALILVPRGKIFYVPSAIKDFAQTPADITLIPRGDGARTGRLWIRTMHSGLFIAGKVEGEQPDFPHTKEQIQSKDHLEVWLAGTPDVDLPEIGWGNQFEDETLPKGEESCKTRAEQMQGQAGGADLGEECRKWAATQGRYRPYFKRLFLRKWLLAPDLGVESVATTAYEEIQNRFSGLGDDVPDIMKPKKNAEMFLFPEQSGYSFEIFIPFEAFPPLPTLRPNELYLLVDVFNAASAGRETSVYSTSSAERVDGEARTFNRLRLETQFYFSLTPCDLPLVGTDKRGGYHPAWFIPERAGGNEYESETFIVTNDPAGYRYEPAGLSPTIRLTDYFWESAAPGEWVCGPHLTYKKGGQSESFPYTISKDGFDLKRLPEGDLLIKTGPRVWYSEFGSGQCGACPRTDLRIFDFTTSMKLFQVLRLGDVMNSPRIFSQDFTVSPDWSQINEYNLGGNEENLPGSWSSNTWCLKANGQNDEAAAHAYEMCGKKENVKPPDPPVLKELRNWEN